METKFSDVANFYLGCEVIFEEEIYKLFSVVIKGSLPKEIPDYDLAIFDDHAGHNFVMFDEVKPILRQLSSMTEGEARQIFLIDNGVEYSTEPFEKDYGKSCLNDWFFSDKYVDEPADHAGRLIGDPRIVLFLCRHGFDIFNLIDSGEAVEINAEKGE